MGGEESLVVAVGIFLVLFIFSGTFRKALGAGLGLIFAGIIFLIIVVVILAGGNL